ncbi:helix-turn-helix domain-containing protein [Actinomadura litoris]|uniref:helix-turn-helix domain-containing protein n=1 Tax=Actinomadura litoris TaxID=2678616 RepID=UPI001FA76EF4|nr:helix-turn-helix transcriptional regulator [Actinomadura litoris]
MLKTVNVKIYCVVVTQIDWTRNLTASIAEQVRRYRKDRGLSAQQLADACKALGLDTSRSAVANFENGRRDTVSVAELVAFAHALDVPPLLLVVPLGVDQLTHLPAGIAASSWEAAQWFAGLDRTKSGAVRLFVRHERYVGEAEFASRKAAAARSMAAAVDDAARRAAHTATAQAADQAVRLAEEIIAETRDDIRAAGLTPPALPLLLTHLT